LVSNRLNSLQLLGTSRRSPGGSIHREIAPGRLSSRPDRSGIGFSGATVTSAGWTHREWPFFIPSTCNPALDPHVEIKGTRASGRVDDKRPDGRQPHQGDRIPSGGVAPSRENRERAGAGEALG